MSEEIKTDSSNSHFPWLKSVLSFACGLALASIGMYNFMESRIERRIREEGKLARLEERVKQLESELWNLRQGMK